MLFVPIYAITFFLFNMADLDEKDDAPKLVAAVLVDYCKSINILKFFVFILVCGLPTEYCEYGPNPAQCAGILQYVFNFDYL